VSLLCPEGVLRTVSALFAGFAAGRRHIRRYRNTSKPELA